MLAGIHPSDKEEHVGMLRTAVTAALLGLAPALAAQETAYFQQGVDYRIEARWTRRRDVLHGRARLRYTNRSPRALDTLCFHQHLNAFRPNSAWARARARVRRAALPGPGPGGARVRALHGA